MKIVIPLITGMIVGAAAVGALASAQDRFDAFQFVDRATYLEKYPADAKSTYLEGLADAISYIRPNDAIGETVSKCLKDIEVNTIFHFYPAVNDFTRQAPPGEPIAAVFLNLLRDVCAGYVK
ncbi:MAG TPA: hypothetical protein DIW51_17760 [Rhodospirillaceae bacterium]|nr:hypothetical protein [Magnetovibrio sp.]HBT43262.1 hypothetical protein [Rhodospirillaceae bacterium]HCS71809.1 hypothetical protein [Rhodospirillaceae bacterium]|tara:strand:+ start:1343 stop:1708 length:366 start_codon:yes stop_codon:yes gene_type:complete